MVILRRRQPGPGEGAARRGQPGRAARRGSREGQPGGGSQEEAA